MESSIDRNRLYAKVKWAIIPYVFALYFFNGMDRTNISFAALTMNKELSISALAFGTITSTFFISYLIFQIPSSMLLKKFGASKLIPSIACLWGLATAGTFFAQDAAQVTAFRFVLGIFEAGFFPGVMYWFTLWFPSRERASVTAIFMLSGTCANIIGAPLAGYMVQYANWFGFSGWRWLFLIEGILPAIIALFGFYIMKDGPEKAKWLNEKEKALIRSDLDAEKAVTTVHTKKIGFAKIITNGTLWKLAMIYMFIQIAQQVGAMWMPVLIKGMTVGLSASAIGYIMMIPAIAGAIAMVLVGNHSDKTGERKWHAITPMLILSASFLLILLPVGGLLFKIAMLSIYGATVVSWYGPYWTMPPAFLSPEIIAVSLAFINSWSAAGGFIGNKFSGIIATNFGNTGVFVFLAAVALVSVVLVLTLDFKKMAIDHIHG
ncbi:MFS transporter [Desulfosporosinus fructosivorans]|uniref:MFS transporter n=1 Tax=Desulfosporosinus fructosivorans TaxID=2018669 RepID=A0A4Z0RCL2_9FIRM|nr:MFS transporter [Desulfosporosinus fructosivorans]TGE39346.1 MFS transporter [Desulfosporosinus fructosivorans]